MKPLALPVLLLSVLASLALGAPPQAIYLNANIHTMDPARPRASAFAIAEGRFLAVGGNEEVRALAGERTQVVDLEGQTVLPGLIDAHGHVAGLGAFRLGVLDLSDAHDEEDMVEAVQARAQKAERGEWIVGGRWDHESWPSKTLPTREMLSRAVPENPVWLRRVDGHAGLANDEAMRRAGVTAETQDPPGGEIVRDQTGEPTGVFVDNAMSLITRAIDVATASSEDLILAAQEHLLSVGLTGAHDAGISTSEAAVYKRLAEEGRLKIRVDAMLAAGAAAAFVPANQPYRSERFSVGAVKAYADGAMGSRGAWLLEPYSDRPTNEAGEPWTGLPVSDPAEIERLAELCARHGWQLRTHAIGDRANREVLDACERALKRTGKLDSDHRFCIEHAQLIAPADIPRFAKLGVIPSMQPRHQTTDMRWVEERVGPQRAKGAYAWASLLREGSRIAAGSDFPVEPASPFLGFYAAVTRQNPEGEPAGGWHPDERMTRTEALRAFTIDAAYAAFREDQVGSIEPGNRADFIVIDRDIMTVPAEEIPQTRVLLTVIDGEEVWRR